MHIFRFGGDRGPRLGLELEGKRYDLSAASAEFAGISTWLALSDPVAAVHRALPSSRSFPITGDVKLLPPLDRQEVWASGVTYLRSKAARMEESKTGADFYDRVYEAERPELFFSSCGSRLRVSGRWRTGWDEKNGGGDRETGPTQ